MSNKNPPIVIIGSGPSGISAAKALLAKGLEVTLVDAGVAMPSEAGDIRDQMARSVPDEWNRDALEQLNRKGLKERRRVPLKTTFGSDFPYLMNPDVTEQGAAILGSHAVGGLSNVWGACILPLSERDIAGWPIGLNDLAEHYQSVFRWLPHSQIPDELAATYPLYSTFQRQLGLSRQARKLMGALRKSKSILTDSGILYGQARLAMSNCFYCGQCLHGCPYEFIYSTNETLTDLRGYPGFSYISNTVVRQLEEHADHVVLTTECGGVAGKIVAGRVFLGAGVLNSALLLMPLLNLHELTIRDSAYNLVPFLRYDRMPKVESESLYTLAQLFMEVDVPDVSARNVHLQWYSYNDFYRQEMEKMLGRLYQFIPSILPQQIIERMWTIQTFLHSDDSPSILLTRNPESARFTLTAVENERAAKVFKATYRKLSSLSHLLGGRPYPIAGRMGVPGGSFHAGASLPMMSHPEGAQSDTAGRPAGLKRIHVIDSSVLPNIASSTITLSVMANAHRIASNYHQYT